VEGSSELGTVRRGDDGPFEDDELDMLLESTLDAIDDATLALHLSRNISSHGARIEKTQQARICFAQAPAELDDRDEDVQTSSAWCYWYDEARKGLMSVQERLEESGEIEVGAQCIRPVMELSFMLSHTQTAGEISLFVSYAPQDRTLLEALARQ
jgi:hypothetical protein